MQQCEAFQPQKVLFEKTMHTCNRSGGGGGWNNKVVNNINFDNLFLFFMKNVYF